MSESADRCRILLVEDESYVRDVACEILEDAGYEVVAAQTGVEAIRLFKEHEPIQLLVTDVVMPGMNGHELSEKLTSLCPQLKTLYMSGYNQEYADNPVPAGDIHQPFLLKPFTLESLSAKVKEVLNG